MSGDFLVSVIVPCYNNASSIENSLHSVLDQTYKHLEIIVIDDGSSDDSPSIVRSINDQRIILIELKTNIGVARARNIGLNKASGEWIQFLDADDILYATKIASQLYLKNHADILVSDCEDIYEDGKRIRYTNRVSEGPASITEFLYRNPFPIHAPIIKKSLIDKANTFNPDYFHEDWEFWIRLSSFSPVIKYIPGVACSYTRIQPVRELPPPVCLCPDAVQKTGCRQMQ